MSTPREEYESWNNQRLQKLANRCACQKSLKERLQAGFTKLEKECLSHWIQQVVIDGCIGVKMSCIGGFIGNTGAGVYNCPHIPCPVCVDFNDGKIGPIGVLKILQNESETTPADDNKKDTINNLPASQITEDEMQVAHYTIN